MWVENFPPPGSSEAPANCPTPLCIALCLLESPQGKISHNPHHNYFVVGCFLFFFSLFNIIIDLNLGSKSIFMTQFVLVPNIQHG